MSDWNIIIIFTQDLGFFRGTKCCCYLEYNMLDIKNILKEFCSISSPSGHEYLAARRIVDCIHKCGERINVETDVLGNICFKKQGKGDKTIMLVAHYDEIGFSIKFIDVGGYIYFTSIGCVDPSILRGQRVLITHNGKQILGVIGATPIHISFQQKHGRNSDYDIGELWIDIGAKSKEEAEKIVSIGDPITFCPNYYELSNDVFTSKGIDNRAGLVALLSVYEQIKDIDTEYTISFVATAQEELGLRGAKIAAYSMAPDVCIVIDVTHATDYSAIDKRKYGYIGIGNGAVIPKGPNFNFSLQQELCEIANTHNVKYQIESISGYSGTDAAEIQLSKGGCRTGLISIPCRYMHTPIEIASFKDIKSVIELLVCYCKTK